jgi:hypothetical protein
MTVSPPGHEHYLKSLSLSWRAVIRAAIAELRSRYDTEQLSALKAS